MDINGHAAIVTGGASGLGASTAKELARLGAKVACIDINLDGARAVADKLGGHSLLVFPYRRLRCFGRGFQLGRRVLNRQALVPPI